MNAIKLNPVECAVFDVLFVVRDNHMYGKQEPLEFVVFRMARLNGVGPTDLNQSYLKYLSDHPGADVPKLIPRFGPKYA